MTSRASKNVPGLPLPGFVFRTINPTPVPVSFESYVLCPTSAALDVLSRLSSLHSDLCTAAASESPDFALSALSSYSALVSSLLALLPGRSVRLSSRLYLSWSAPFIPAPPSAEPHLFTTDDLSHEPVFCAFARACFLRRKARNISVAPQSLDSLREASRLLCESAGAFQQTLVVLGDRESPFFSSALLEGLANLSLMEAQALLVSEAPDFTLSAESCARLSRGAAAYAQKALECLSLIGKSPALDGVRVYLEAQRHVLLAHAAFNCALSAAEKMEFGEAVAHGKTVLDEGKGFSCAAGSKVARENLKVYVERMSEAVGEMTRQVHVWTHDNDKLYHEDIPQTIAPGQLTLTAKVIQPKSDSGMNNVKEDLSGVCIVM